MIPTRRAAHARARSRALPRALPCAFGARALRLGLAAPAALLAAALAAGAPAPAEAASLNDIETLSRARLAEFARPEGAIWQDYGRLAALAGLGPVFARLDPPPAEPPQGAGLLDAPPGRFAPQAIPAFPTSDPGAAARPPRAPRPRPTANAATAMALLAARLEEGMGLDALLLQRLREGD